MDLSRECARLLGNWLYSIPKPVVPCLRTYYKEGGNRDGQGSSFHSPSPFQWEYIHMCATWGIKGPHIAVA